MDGGQVCNIGPAQRRRRLYIGLPLAVVGVIASFMTKSFFAQVVAFFGFLSLFQVQSGTCVGLASRGARHMDDRMELLDDADEIAFFKREARRIYARTFFATLALLLISRAYLHYR